MGMTTEELKDYDSYVYHCSECNEGNAFEVWHEKDDPVLKLYCLQCRRLINLDSVEKLEWNNATAQHDISEGELK
jgi:hypothetical protein